MSFPGFSIRKSSPVPAAKFQNSFFAKMRSVGHFSNELLEINYMFEQSLKKKGAHLAGSCRQYR